MTTPFGFNDRELARRASFNAGRIAPAPSPSPTPPSTGSYLDYVPKYQGLNPAPAPSISVGGIGSGIIDLLSRGVYASAGFSKELVKNIQGDTDAGNAFGAALKGLTGENKQTYSDVITEIDPDAPEWVKFTGGLAGDILLDPANLLFGGAGALARAGIKASQAGKIAAKTAEEAANAAAPALTAAERKLLPQVSLGTRSDTTIPLLSVNRRAGLESNSRIAKVLDPVRKLVTPGYGYEEMSDALRSGANTAETRVSDFRKYHLNRISKDHTEANIQAGYSAYRRGVVPKDPAAKAAMDAQLLGIEKYSSVADPALRELASTKQGVAILNKALKDKGIKFRFDHTKAMTSPRSVGWSTMTPRIDPVLLLRQVKDWDVVDPLAFMDQMHQAVVKAKVNTEFAKAVVQQSGKLTARPGHVLLKDLQDTELGPYLSQAMNGKRYYFNKDVADQLTRVNHFMSQPTSFKDSETLAGKAIKNVVVPVMNIWKPYMTIARPGHHVRNLYSDSMITAMDGVATIGPYKKALKALKAGGALKRTGVPGLTEIEQNVTKGADKLATVRLRGSNVDVSTDKMYKTAYNEGLLPSHQVTEDFVLPAQEARIGNDKVSKALLENRYIKGMGTVAEQTNHFTRMAHFIGLMEQKKFTRQFDSYEDAARAAAVRVKKHHPDPSGLTPFEQKNMRLAFPFYSWTRQTLPAVLNAAISKPGRVTGLSKTAYEFSKAMGMDPTSIGDPFPDNVVYPSFVHENLLGPLAETGWGQLGLNTGSPQESIFGDVLNSSPMKYVAGNMNPIIKGILEMTSGTNLDTGKPIINRADRTDQSLPLINQIPKLTGVSPTGTLAEILGRQGVSLVPSASEKRGTNNEVLNLINLLTGVGASDFTNSTYRNIAKQELTNQ